MDDSFTASRLLDEEMKQTNSDPMVQALDILALGITARNLIIEKRTGEKYGWTDVEQKVYERAIFALRGVGRVIPT